MLTQVLLTAGLIVGFVALVLAAGALLSDGPGKGIAWGILVGLAVLTVVLVVFRRSRRVSLDESLRSRSRES